MTKKSKEKAQVDAYLVCDEGGTHEFASHKSPSCCGTCMCLFCFPCYAVWSCLLTKGTEFVTVNCKRIFCLKLCNPSSEEPGDEGKATCKKCGLTEREAIDLSDARAMEASRGARNTGYFSNAMLLPSAATSNQPNSNQGQIQELNKETA
ncbi:hypothetical protein O181_004876 [Austropuccinia psidii MF-1]|uniref:Uncharacterized protein n=1 Tax=Austropuccinia psidii MF-1 TaxID=1389203 RepID=A0A9Q3GFF3_9BASI|nr:hypothetical protein [Austropuccinia psidii MF-1]